MAAACATCRGGAARWGAGPRERTRSMVGSSASRRARWPTSSRRTSWATTRRSRSAAFGPWAFCRKRRCGR
eukprot:8513550-Lingulodinium_polyedra.AAC.1